MKTNIQIFKNEVFGEIRTMTNEKGETFFVGKDVAQALGYSNSRKALLDHVDEEDKGVTKRDTLGGKQQLIVINESGLYALIPGTGVQALGDLGGAASHPQDGPLRDAAARDPTAGREG